MIWIVMILTGLANFAVRFSMFSGLRASTLPDWAERYLRYVPTAVLRRLSQRHCFWMRRVTFDVEHHGACGFDCGHNRDFDAIRDFHNHHRVRRVVDHRLIPKR